MKLPDPSFTLLAPTSAPPGVVDSDILVVDDIEWNRALIGTLLEESGYNRIRYAVDGLDALEKITEKSPDLLVLDIMMPRMDGFELLRRLRANHAYAELPVLVQTALSGVEDRNRAFECGTTDLVTKPLDRTELLARVNIHLENRALIRDLMLYRDRLEGELRTARDIFEHLLPSAKMTAQLAQASGLTIQSHLLRSSELGGDIWGLLDLGQGRIGVYLLDMAGRGVSAALNVCRVHTLVQELLPLATMPAQFLTELNRRTHDLMITGEHAAMIYGVLIPNENRFCYASAAANAPMLLLPDTKEPCFGNAFGAPLGAIPDVEFEQHDLLFPPGSGILFYSNAILDALDRVGIEDLHQGLAQLLTPVQINTTASSTVAACFPAIVSRLSEMIGDAPSDDHALVWLAR